MLMHFMNLKDGIKIFSRVILKRSLNEKSEKEDGIQREEERNRFYPLRIFGFSGESEAGLDEGVEEGRLEPLSQEDCASNYSASSSRRVRNQPESLSLTVSDPFTEKKNLRRTRERNENSSGEKSPFFLDRFEVEAILYYIRLVKIVFKFSKLVSNDFTDQ